MRNINVLLSFLLLFVCIYAPSLAYAEDELSLGIFPRRNVEDTIRMYTPLAEYITEKTGIKVRIKTARDFETFWKHVSNKRFHLVHYNPYDYIKSAREYGYRVILKNEEKGADKLAGAIFVNKSSGITDIKELKGKRIIFGGGPSAMFSYLLPTYLLQQNGLSAADYKKEYAISPPNAVFATYYGHADAAGAGEVVIGFDVVKKKIDTTKLQAIAVSQKLTHLPWAVRDDVDQQVVNKIQKLLSELSQTERGKQVLKSAALTGLNISSDEEYDEHRKIIWHVRGENYCVRGCDYIEKSRDDDVKIKSGMEKSTASSFHLPKG
jgi:phosphonate transport system substrate-binding protein